MAKRIVSNEMKAGVLVVVCIAVLLGLLYKTGNFNFKKEGYTVKATFSIAAGMQRNAPVRLAGVEIGKVRDIQLVYDKGVNVVVTLWLNNNARLRTDSRAFITALGPTGEKYIEVTVGSNDASYLEPGGAIAGEDPLQFESPAKKGEVITANLDETLSSIRDLAKNTNLVVTNNKEKIDNIFDNLEATTQNMKEFTEDIKRNPWKLMSKGK